MKHKYIKKFLTCSLALVMVITSLTQMAIHANAEELNLAADTIYVDSADDLIEIAKASRGIGIDVHQFENKTIILQNDIDLTDKTIPKELGVLTIGGIGTEYLPFKGIFDGNGYTITGLNNQKGVLPDHNIGLFSETERATIKNLTLDQANVNAAYEAGILVGEANNTLIENVVVKNSKLKVQPANNVVSLITNLGTNGGAIAGKISDSVLYNCESVNTTVYNNTTSGITGVGGERLDLGGLVGYSIKSTIEYSRVRGGRVKNEYNIAVGALGGKELMTGGIVGEMNQTKVIDCFSTTDLISYGRNIVSVGSGIAGYTGGIAGVIYEDGNEIIRSHFAGTLDSYQYNAIAVIPIIQYDVNLAGLVGTNALGSSLTVEDSFYRQDTLNTDNNSDIDLLGFKGSTVTNSRGLSSREYEDKSLWKDAGYDFFAEEERSTVYNDSHYNQWVMDYELKMPIHGHSLSATFDFPGAAEVSIEKKYTDWNLDNDEDETAVPIEMTSSHSTNNPYQFAVMGYDTNQDEMTLQTSMKPAEQFTDNEKPYLFKGWYKRQEKYQGDSIPELPSFFKDIISEQNGKVSDDLPYQLALKDNNVEDNNDLYVAHYQARVLFYDTDGDVINGNKQYFDYQDKLPEVTLTIPDECTFYGWTTIKNEQTEAGSYIGITSNQLSRIIDADELYQTGDLIEKPMKLYPIFTNYVSNVQVIVEGHDQDDIGNMSLRENVAEAKVILDENQNIVLNVVGLENEILPDGYRFLGWYEIDSVDDYSSQVGHRVSKEMTYTLPDDIDLTKKHYYIARFEYRVDYKVYWLEEDKKGEEDFAEIWETYKSNFEEIDGPVSYYEKVEHWGKDKLENVCSNDNCEKVTSSDLIVKPLVVWGHIKNVDTNYNAHTVDVSTDFPGSGTIGVDYEGTMVSFDKATLEIIPNDNYSFCFWTIEDRNIGNFMNINQFEANVSNDRIFIDAFKDSIGSPKSHYFYGRAHMTANVKFNGIPNGSVSMTVNRIYEEKVFLINDINHKYSFEADYNKTNYNEKIDNFLKDHPVVSAASPSKDEMKKDGYLFLGWIDKNNITDEEFNYIYGGKVEDSTYATDDARKAIPYLLDDSAIVTKPMDLYPVYVTTNFTTTTNIKESGITDAHLNIALPIDPKYSKDSISTTNGYADITFTVDNNKTSVLKKGDTDTKYQFKYLEYVDATGKTIQLNLDDTSNNTVKVSNILLGPSYKFIAYYEPYVLTYHVSDNESQFEVRNSGDKVGQQPDAKFTNVDNSIFIGWTNEKPNSGNYHTNNENLTLIDSDDYVTGSMELWAVYQNANITVTSNIDNKLDVNQLKETRGWRKSDNGGYELFAKETVKVGNQNYVFCGWKNLEDATDYITTSPNYSMNPLENKRYIAIYKESVTVTYHFNDKEFQTVQVVADERSFVETIEVDGENITSMIDTDIMQSMMSTLDKDDLFIQWQWYNGEEMVDWSNFSESNISQDMDLYPVVYHLSAKDSQDNQIDDMTFGYVYDENKDDSQLEPTEPTAIHAYLSIPYTQEKLTVIVTKTSGNDFEKTQVSDKDVTLWVADENMSIDEKPKPDDEDVVDPYEEYGTEETDENGKAVFTFTGQLKITKKMSDDSESSDTFIFTLEKKVNDDVQKIEIPLTMKGNQTSITVQLPCGQYKVSEDESWAWRYGVTSEIGSVNEEGYINIIPYYSKKPREITFTNEKTNDKWFNAIDHEPNVFGKGGNS